MSYHSRVYINELWTQTTYIAKGYETGGNYEQFWFSGVVVDSPNLKGGKDRVIIYPAMTAAHNREKYPFFQHPSDFFLSSRYGRLEPQQGAVRHTAEASQESSSES